MIRDRRSCLHWSLGTLAAVILGLAGVPAWALGPGAPPVFRFASVEVTTTDGGAPRLMAGVEVEVPGGNVPVNVQSVTVTAPPADGRTFALALSHNDLFAERQFELNLTSVGVSGFPPGTYTFTATDTAGGVATATDDLGVTTGLPAAASVSVSGLLSVPPAGGGVNLLNLTTTPTPTVSWTPVPGAATHRVLLRSGLGDQNLFVEYTGNSTTSSMTLPAGIMVHGRRYFVRVDAFDHINGFDCSTPPFICMDANARSKRNIEVVTQGPEVFLTFGTTINGMINYSAGQTLDVTTRIYNTGPAVKVNANAWIGLPTGGVIPILNLPNLAIPNSTANPTGPNDFYTGSIGFSYMFNGSEPSGNYVVGLRLTDPDTNETVALATRTFAK